MLFVNSFTTHFTNFHTSENVRYGQDYSPGRSNLLNYLISRATIPNIRCAGGGPNSVAIWDNRCTQHYAVMDYWPAVRKMERRASSATNLTDGEEPCSSWTIACCPKTRIRWSSRSPCAPSFLPTSDDIAVSMKDQVQKAVDCYNAGATVLHVHVREPDGKGSKRLEMFNEMLDRLRSAVPGMILQVGGSISFAPKDEGEAAKWLATTRATCWPSSIRSRTRSPSRSTPTR